MKTSQKKQDVMLSRSNQLIQARYKSSLLENQILVLSLKRAKKDDMGRPSVTITSQEILQLTGMKNHNVYKQLKDISKDLIDITFYLEDDVEKKFKYFNLVNNAEYQAGKFTINFTPECNALLYNLQSNYTTISLEMLFGFTNNYSFRLYELLKVHAYKIDYDNTAYDQTLSLADLKLQMGCIDTDEPAVKKALRSDSVDSDDIVENIAKKKKYDSWYDFRRFVLEKAVAEINEKTELFVSYKPIRSGRGAKIRSVQFFIQKKEKDLSITREEYDEEIQNVFEILSEIRITKQDAEKLLEASDHNLEEIERIYRIAQKQAYIKNMMGWLLDAIKNGYQEPIEVLEGNQKRAEEANKFKQSADQNKDEVSLKIWGKIKENKHFPEFILYVEKNLGFEMQMYDFLFTAQEKMEAYTTWLREKNKTNK